MNILNTAAAVMIPALEVTPTPPPGSGDMTNVIGWILFVAGLAFIAIAIVIGVLIASNGASRHGGPIGSRVVALLAGLLIAGAASSIVGYFIKM